MVVVGCSSGGSSSSYLKFSCTEVVLVVIVVIVATVVGYNFNQYNTVVIVVTRCRSFRNVEYCVR